MKRFLFGVGVIGMLVATAALLLDRGDAIPPMRLVLLLIALPVAVSWVLTELIHVARPRRLFIGRRRSGARLVAQGMATGVTALLLGAIGLAFLDRWFADTFVMAIAFALAVPPAVLMLSRHRPGHCPYCNYDLRGATVGTAGRCVECGEEGT